MSSRYSSGVVLVQSSSRSSAYSAPRSSTYSSSSRSTVSMDSSSASRTTTDARYRSGSSTGYYTDVKEVPSSRGGSSVVVVHHNRGHSDKDEPRSSDHYSRSSYGKK